VVFFAIILLGIGIWIISKNNNEKKEVDKTNTVTNTNSQDTNIIRTGKPNKDPLFNCLIILFIFLGVILCITSIVTGGLDTNSALDEKPTIEPIQKIDFMLSADDLYNEYERNGVAADEKYRGKIVVVSGKIYDINKDIIGDPYVIIGGSGFLDGVHCTFLEEEIPSLSNLYDGQYISVQGKVGGQVLGSVMVNDCKLK
jgi:hypothetical protein